MDETIIGEGSYGVVYHRSKSDSVNKHSFWVTENATGERYIVPSTIREVCFYQIMRRAASQADYSFLNDPPPSINRAKSVSRRGGSVIISQRHRGKRLTRVFDDERTRGNFQRIFSQILQGLAWLHSFGCSHGDIKADNILVDLHMNAALIDFGSCSFFHNQIFTQSALRCTITTIAPEELVNKRWTLASDIWSLGVVMFEFLSKRTFVIEVMEAIGAKLMADEWQRLVFKDCNSSNITEAEYLLKNLFIVSTTPNGIKTAIMTNIRDKEIQELLVEMLVVDRKARPTAEVILGMKIFSGEKEKIFPKWDPEAVSNNGVIEYKDVKLQKIEPLDRQIALQFMSLMVHMPKSPFPKTWFGHAAMLFDRWMFRAATKRTLPINLSPHVVAVLAITGCVLNPHYMSVADIALHAKCSGDELEEVIGEILDELHWNCFNWSPDLLVFIKTGRYPSTKMQLQVYQQLPIFSDGAGSVGDLIHEARTANE
jgi:serine/threonine protein kinase